MIVHYDLTAYPCEKACKTDHEVILYDENDVEIFRISNISDCEWNFITIEDGEWTTEPTEMEIMRADLDYCLMLLEGL